MAFFCSICEEESTRICVLCTKDTCTNHLCERCGCCSDCCDCEVPLEEFEPVHEPIQAAAPAPVHSEVPPNPDPAPEPPHPPPDPDPDPDPVAGEPTEPEPDAVA